MGNDGLIGLPAPLDDEIDQRTRLGAATVEQVEELVEEAAIAWQGEPLTDAARDRGTERRPEPSLCSPRRQAADPVRMSRGVIECDRTAVGHSHHDWSVKAE